VNKSKYSAALSITVDCCCFVQDVRSSTDNDFSFNITYREFTAEMMQELISHSLYCSQKIKYDCYKAPLELHSATWFVSSMESDIVDYLGNVKRGACPCAGMLTHPVSFQYAFLQFLHLLVVLFVNYRFCF
jgi:hypothetical protein